MNKLTMKSSIAAFLFIGLVLVSNHFHTATAFAPQISRSTHVAKETGTALFGVRSTVRNIFRRRGVKTLEQEDTTSENIDDEPKRPYRLIYYDSCDYGPEGVARVIAKLIPSLKRREAYQLCSFARTNGKVPLIVTDQNDAERYCAVLRQYGLKASVEPHVE